MIAFDGPEGQQLRALHPLQSATAALWLVALTDRNDAWATWAQRQRADAPQSGEILALRFIQAVSDTDESRARQLWQALASHPFEGGHSHIITAAHDLRRSIGF